MEITDLPALNATLNGIAAVMLAFGYIMIRKGQVVAHRRAMLGALATSALFLISYVLYHLSVGSVPYAGQGVIRFLYFAILVTHVALAATVLPLALITATRGLRADFERHTKIARWTFPIWLYVSVTGVVIYLMLYQL
jgi:uncharacterized membrane protein YozB (DUF420 family)